MRKLRRPTPVDADGSSLPALRTGRDPDRVMSIAAAIVLFCETWLATGLVVGLWFVLYAVGRIDHAAHGAYAFRPLLLPGVALLWPFVLWRSLRLLRLRREAH